jgi:acetyl-CoA carboxylase biotin carboxyl carrier protein
MDINDVKKLIKLVERSKIAELEIFEKGSKIRISKNGSSPAQAHMMAPVMPAVATPAAPTAPDTSAPPAPVETPANIVDVRSPMVGTFYRSPSPDAEPYIKVGDPIEPGKVLCIVEAMKLMNELEAEIAGRIAEIRVENGQPVEYDQVLFRVEVTS